jgi:hypothetical protein
MQPKKKTLFKVSVSVQYLSYIVITNIKNSICLWPQNLVKNYHDKQTFFVFVVTIADHNGIIWWVQPFKTIMTNKRFSCLWLQYTTNIVPKQFFLFNVQYLSYIVITNINNSICLWPQNFVKNYHDKQTFFVFVITIYRGLTFIRPLVYKTWLGKKNFNYYFFRL